MSTASATASGGHRALLRDGSPVRLRRLGPRDRPAVAALHRDLPDGDHYLRFFTASRTGGRLVTDVVLAPDAVAVGAEWAGRLLGVAHYRPDPGGDPEVAFVVAHPEQGHGIASLLLEELVAAAGADGVPRLVAEVLTGNQDMLRVLRDSGLIRDERVDGDVVHVVLHVPGAGDRGDLGYRDAVVERAAAADVASLRPVLAPRSVVVVGAGRRADSVGRMVLRSIVDGGFAGPVVAVNPHTDAVAGVPCHRTVGELPLGIDLAVLCVPAAAVPAVAAECGRRRVRALLVVTAGISTDPVLAAGLTDAAARYGMRLVGPNCLGLVATDPGVRLQATFGRPALPGIVGLTAQSGGVIIALTAELDRLGLGVSTAVSIGDALDVNGDDLLAWWAADGRTRAAVLHVESLRRPRRFAALARRLARRMPLVTVRSGSTDAGRRAAASHSAGTATPRVVRDALFAQAGVLAVDELGELGGLLALLCRQPLPTGPRTAVLSNAGGLGVLAADALVGHGLTVAEPGGATRRELAALLPPGATLAGPVDTTATVTAEVFARALALLRDDADVDAVLAVGVGTGAGDPLAAVGPTLARPAATPVVLVRPGQAETVRVPPGPDPGPGPGAAPVFADPAVAARALAAALRRARWLRRPDTPAGEPPGIDAARVRAVAAAGLEALPAAAGGGWLDPARARDLADAAGLALVATDVVADLDAALARWRAVGGPVALKADVPGLVHKSRAGAVRTGLDSPVAIATAVQAFRARFGTRLRGIVVQPMAPPGTELLVGVTTDPLCGPLLTLGLGGTTTDLVDDRTHCLVPATEGDLDELLDGLRSARRLFGGDRGARLRAAARDTAGRLGRLAELLPTLAEAEVNPLVVGEAGPVGVDLRVRLAPAPPPEPWLRDLPN